MGDELNAGRNRKRVGAPPSLIEAAETQTLGEFLRGVAMWPRDAGEFVIARSNKRVCQFNGEDAAEMSSVIRCIAACVEHDGDVDGAARLRVLVALLDKKAGPRWASHWTAQRIADDDRAQLAVYVCCREVMRAVRVSTMPAANKREFVDMLSGELRALLDFENPTGINDKDNFAPVTL